MCFVVVGQAAMKRTAMENLKRSESKFDTWGTLGNMLVMKR
jgi:hypothetical protein